MTRVSVGLPVYNGAQYLRIALDSLVGQTHEDLEIILSDNGSTDATEAICREYAARDPRIRYIRHPVNRGGAFNHDFVVEQATAPYFRLFAHDDYLAPTCIERAARVLDERPDVILAWTDTVMVDETGAEIPFASDQFFDDRTPSSRIDSLLGRPLMDSLLNWCSPQFGVTRREAMTGAFPLPPYAASDRVLLVRLALLGRWHRIPERLFFRRQHTGNSFQGKDMHEVASWMVPTQTAGRSMPHIRMQRDYFRAALTAPVSLRERVRCLGVVLRAAAHLDVARAAVWDLRVLAKELVSERRDALRQRRA